jgi:hypothetical protein
MTKEFGPWITWGKPGRPSGLDYSQRIEVVCHDEDGELETNLQDRTVLAHAWVEGRTLLYRVEIKETTHVVYGKTGGIFDNIRYSGDTHKITYVVRGGMVVSCMMGVL